MGKTQGVFIANTQNTAFIRVVGTGTYQNSLGLRRTVLELHRRGYTEFLVDLTDCEWMDSTFVGLLAGIGLRLKQSDRRGCLYIIGVSERNAELLQSVGLSRLARIELHTPAALEQYLPDDMAFTRIDGSEPGIRGADMDAGETADLVLESHEDLVRADERNEAKFGEVIRQIRQEIGRCEAQ